MTPTITDSWARIETWLAAHAPATFAALAPPAKPERIAAAEEAIGLAFPEPLKESLLRHDGSADASVLPPFWSLLGAEAVEENWELRVEIYEDELEEEEEDDEDDPESEFGPWWNRAWIPFAKDGAGDYLVIDLRPGPRAGRIGNADHELGGHFKDFPMWSSLPALLDATATSLETGEQLGNYAPFVNEDGGLDWHRE
ncbi:SMI1/KNR4 family protein [Streptomyces sp. NPDC048172]|uniref:SMI1/KNR4 family protein n=1 Tax=Streptomyces sp. NPDC048172 TaxID=3365505 RepID=UPI003711F575